jgi:hypothetical protein
MEVFSNQHKWMQKERAAANVEASRSVDYLRDEVASRLCERVLVRSLLLLSSPPSPLTLAGHQSPLPPRPGSWCQCMQHCERPHIAISRRT